ncbi:O(6)-methylguanine-induced apoptosis 2 isoform X2 [Tachysurus fulvidraco]|uniref:O(6)-methylguanine-induced apoptosis 2 isoform X2 n=1 Tax=Tachysurus fulvidraco TaxID=1234273 RepID=UPI001FEF42BE|nr:O(6)-methylguanine-induced apoptosis 2 isoform X2 [Tachysurus fulvidraco]
MKVQQSVCAVEMGEGCVRADPGCMKFPGSSSIPTKYQTVIISNVERKGFSSQAKRFTPSINENPAPGSYLSHTSADSCSPSYSMKGTGSFASKAFRTSRKPQTHTSPAPNIYNLQSSLLRQHDFNRDVSRTFHLPIAVQTPNTHQKSPAPNQYNVCYSGVEVNSVVSAQAAFLSKTKRSDVYPSAAKGPSPCHYNVKDAVIQKSPKIPLSCFKSTSSRIQTSVRSEGPGPGSYSPYNPPEPVTRTIIPRRHYLGLSAPPLIPPKDPPLPGPGQYDIVNYTKPPKHLMASAVFLSNTRRQPHHTRGHGVPGPGSYEPDVPTKRSFLYNHANMWIPA